MTASFPGVILSGGKSSRMGEPKALLPFGSARLIDHIAARLKPQVTALAINSNTAEIMIAGAPSFADCFDNFPGPLAGIHASLAFAQVNWPDASHIAVVPIDAPFFPADLVSQLETVLTGPDDIALGISGGQMHPVTGLWPVSVLDRLASWLENPPTLKVRAFLDGLPVRTVAFPNLETPLGPLDPFFNINTPEDLARAREMLEAANREPI
jgi:molybdopterin-guanine dinucleotide biosynthesis protein A